MSIIGRERFHMRNSSELILTRFVMSFSLGLFIVATSLYLRDAGLSDSWIGIAGSIAGLLVIALSPVVPVLLEKFNGLTIFKLGMAVMATIMLAMGLSSHLAVALLAFTVHRLALSVTISAASISVRDSSGSKELEKIQGLASSLMNFGWVVGPLLGGLALAVYGLSNTFFISAAVMLIGASILVMSPLKAKPKIRAKIDSSWIENVRFYFSRPGLVAAYVFRGGITAWMTFLFTFIPLFMVNEGYSLQAVGMALALTQLPLFLMEFKTVDLIIRLNSRRLFIYGFSLMAAFQFAFFTTDNLLFTIIGFIVSSVLALSILEPLVEIYFYKQVKPLEEEKAYPVFSTAEWAGSLSIKLLTGLSIGLFGTRSSFLVLAMVMSMAALFAIFTAPRADKTA